MADPSREVSVGSCALRLRSPVLRVEPNRERASVLHSRRVSEGAHASASLLPGLFPPDRIRSVGYLVGRSSCLFASPPSRGFATGSSRRCGFGPLSSADLLVLQLSFGNAAIELGDGQISSVSQRQPRWEDGNLVLETPRVAPA